MRSTPRTPRAFSLIELLVVISIVALIVAILLPSLSGARRQGQSLQCLARLSQLGMGWHMYADDYDDVAVPGRYGNLAGGASNPANFYDVGSGLKFRPRWIALMGKYVGAVAFENPLPADRQDYDHKVYQCPSVPDWMDERNHAYGYNHQFLGNARITNGRYHNFPVNRSKITSFASTVMAADTLGTAAGFAPENRKPYNNNGTDFAELANHGWTLDPPRLKPESEHGSGDPGSPRTAVDPRHLNKSNVIFCDGHGETVTPRRLGYRTDATGAFVDDAAEDPPHNREFSGTGRDTDPPLPPART